MVEIRISIKGVQQSKVMPSGQKVPNFGFVVFETDDEAKECLAKVPIHLPDGHRLNVETKKNKQMRAESGGGPFHSLSGSGGSSGMGGGGGGPGQGGGLSNKNRNSMSSSNPNAGGGSSFGGSQELRAGSW